MLSDLSETLHSKWKLRFKQVAKIWCLYLKKQKIGAMLFSEGLKDSPFTNSDRSEYGQSQSE